MEIQLGILAVGVLVLVQGAVLWRLLSTQRTIGKLSERLVHQGEALSLLTDTSESGFSAIAREMERLATTETKATRKPSTRRVATAARKGRTIAEIAARERVSEGEVRLRLHLAGQELGEQA
jgi:DNA-directed RNA polymerase specialized sigma24 family protein